MAITAGHIKSCRVIAFSIKPDWGKRWNRILSSLMDFFAVGFFKHWGKVVRRPSSLIFERVLWKTLIFFFLSEVETTVKFQSAGVVAEKKNFFAIRIGFISQECAQIQGIGLHVLLCLLHRQYQHVQHSPDCKDVGINYGIIEGWITCCYRYSI